MIIELQRNDLLLLCKQIASSGYDVSKNKYKDAFEIRPFVNGPAYRLSDKWVAEQTDEQLLNFCIYHSSTIKLIKP